MPTLPTDAGKSDGLFPPTEWAAILLSGSNAGASLEAVYETYRKPLVLYLLWRRFSPEDAADLVQGFFERLAHYGSLAEVQPSKGRFRTFLITAMKHYLSDRRDWHGAAKRGGGRVPLSLDELASQEGIDPAFVDQRSPEWAFDRAWAEALLRGALAELEQELKGADREPLFRVLAPILHGGPESLSYRELAVELRTTEGAVKVAAKRLRERLNQLIRRRVRGTVSDPSLCAEEIRYLVSLLGEG